MASRMLGDTRTGARGAGLGAAKRVRFGALVGLAVLVGGAAGLGCGSRTDETPDQAGSTEQPAAQTAEQPARQTGDQVGQRPEQQPAEVSVASMELKAQRVEAACGECQFGMPGNGCDLAIRYEGVAYFVDGTAIDDHGDAHADDGFCNAIRTAIVDGRVENGRFVATAMRLESAE